MLIVNSLSKVLSRIDRGYQAYQMAKTVYAKTLGRFVTPFGKILYHNPEISEDKVVGRHGGCATKWIPQAEKANNIAKNGGLFLGPAAVAVQYADGKKQPALIEIASEVVPNTDHTSGIGAHLCLADGTPFAVRTIHEVNPEYIEHQEKINQIEKPSLVKCILTHKPIEIDIAPLEDSVTPIAELSNVFNTIKGKG